SDVVPTIAGSSITASEQAARDPLLRFADLSDVHVARAARMELPSWGRTVIDSNGGPLLIVGQEENRNVALFAFDLHDTDLPLQTAFPLLMRNLVTYLLPLPAGGLPAEVTPGDPVSISKAEDSVTSIVVEDPSAREQTWAVSQLAGQVAFGDTSSPGVYYVTQYGGDKIVAQEAFAVNLFSRAE